MNTSISRRLRFSTCGIVACALFFLLGNGAQGIIILPITRTVTQNGDSGAGSLRQTVANSGVGDIVVFNVTGAITLTSVLTLTKDIIISGPGSRKLRITGGFVSISSGDVNISGLTIGGNCGISVIGGKLTMSDCAVSGNMGGGVFANAGTTLTMNNCTISNNQLDIQAGAGVQNEGTATLTNCTITGNASVKQTIQGMTFGGTGGGVSNSVNTGVMKLINCTVAGNSAEGVGGGIESNGGTYQLTNTIVANNTAASGPDCFGTFTSNGYSLIRLKDGGTGFVNNVNHDLVGGGAVPINVQLGSLLDNGGGTDTIAFTSGASPGVNEGNGATAPSRDQRGYIRPDTTDIGAFEFNGTQPVVLANIASRVQVQTGDDTLIGGFIITGTQPKKIIIRAIGPSLNLAGQLADPVLELYAGNQLVASNDNWKDAPNKQAIIDSTVPPTNDSESAILLSVSPGNYTAIVRGAGGATGIGVVELYDLDRTVNSRLANISSRALVQGGDNVLIGGFIVFGTDNLQVIIGAIGPSLGLANRLLDPILTLYDNNGVTLAENDNWRTTQQSVIIATGVPPTNDAESAIFRTLAPGNYTAIVRGVNGTTGVAVVEAYGIQ